MPVHVVHVCICCAALLLLLVAERARLQRFGLLVASLPAVRLDTHSASRSQPQGADSNKQ